MDHSTDVLSWVVAIAGALLSFLLYMIYDEQKETRKQLGDLNQKGSYMIAKQEGQEKALQSHDRRIERLEVKNGRAS